MGKTYCIVPKKRRMLQELLHGMELATDEETHLAACTILHVEIDPAANGWEIVLQTQSFLQPGILTRMAEHIRERCGLTSVVFYQQVIDIVQGIDDAWDTLAERVAAGNQAVWTVLERATHTVADGKLKTVREALRVQLYADGTLKDLAEDRPLDPDTVVSMNFWGFTPSIFPALRTYFEDFLRNEAGDNIKAECLLPVMVDSQMQAGKLEVSVLKSADRWFGMTYQQDREVVAEELKKLHQMGAYPEDLRV